MNILSIDFDIIMEPTINYYNGWTGKGWKNILKENPGFITAKASFFNFNSDSFIFIISVNSSN